MKIKKPNVGFVPELGGSEDRAKVFPQETVSKSTLIDGWVQKTALFFDKFYLR